MLIVPAFPGFCPVVGHCRLFCKEQISLFSKVLEFKPQLHVDSSMQIHTVFYFNYIIYSGLLIFRCHNVATPLL